VTESIADTTKDAALIRRGGRPGDEPLAHGADAAPAIALQIVTTIDELAAIADAWAELHAECLDAKFAVDPYWCRRMWERLEGQPGRRPQLVIGRVAGRLRLVWPLVTFRQRLWRIAQPMSEDLSDFDDMLVAPAPDADRWRREAWDFMLAALRPDVVLCRRVPAGSGLDRVIGRDRWRWEKGSASPYVDFRKFPCWDDYYRSLSKKTRSTIRNRRNRLKRFGELRLEQVSDRQLGSELIAWMFMQKHRRLGTRAHSKREKMSFAHFGHDIPFLADVTRNAFLDGRMKVLRLTAGDATVAVMTGLITGRRMVGWLYGYAPEYLSGSPGRILFVEGLAWAKREQMEVVDFMPDPEPYKAEWTDDSYPVRDVRIAVTPWGRAIVAWYRSPVRDLLMKLYMQLPQPAQALIRRLSS
jgi:CelD/BcsL family acetyltransferase involved in cellulose biosynthesis